MTVSSISACSRGVLLGLALIASAQCVAQDVVVTGAWARAMPPTSSGTAAYMTLTNRSDVAVKVVGASSPRAQRVELHTTVQQDGMMRMRAVPSLLLEPGESADLAPGGLHLMVMRLDAVLSAGDTLPLCINIEENDTPICFESEVRAPPTPANAH